MNFRKIVPWLAAFCCLWAMAGPAFATQVESDGVYCFSSEDFAADQQQGNYNPILLRYGTEGNDSELKDTMTHSLEMACAALQLGDFGCRMPVLENILYLGLPLVQRSVFDGTWSRIKKQKIWSNDT